MDADENKRDRKEQMEELNAHWRWFVWREGRRLESLERWKGWGLGGDRELGCSSEII
jgi:hypothetical protein